jgi:hypothetical protein
MNKGGSMPDLDTSGRTDELPLGADVIEIH